VTAPRITAFAAIGDSFTAGSHPGVASWATLLIAALRRAEPRLLAANFAVVGARSTDVAERQLDPAIALRPDLAIVVCGANDVLLTPRPDLAGFRRTFAGILARLSGETDALVATATYPGAARFAGLRERSRLRVQYGFDAVNEAVREEAEAQGVLCFDFAGHPDEQERGNYADDGFHPSAEGHRRAAAAFALGLRHHLGVDLDGRIELESAA
jgi:lysophospholipase L1-like esterase